MNRKLAILAAVIAAFTFTCQSANAGGRHHHVDKRITAVAIGVGAASTATFFALNDWHFSHWDSGRHGITSLGAWGLTTVGCIAASPIVATVVLNRPLTQREAHILAGSCVIPLIGGWLVNEAYNAHPEWEPVAERHAKTHHHHHKKKMM